MAAPGQLARGERRPEAVEGADAERGQGVQRWAVAKGAEAEEAVHLGQFQRRQDNGPLLGGELVQGGQQVGLGGPFG